MKTPISLQRLADSIGAHIEPLNFKAHGRAMRGWAIVDSDNNELLECEPVYYSNGDRWKIDNKSDKLTGLKYVKTLRGLDRKINIKPGYTGYKFSTLTTGNSGRMLTVGTIVNT